jgi:hypothetical protein
LSPDGLSIARRKTLSLDLICIVAVYFVDACPGKVFQTQPAVRVRVTTRVRVRVEGAGANQERCG